MGRLIDADKLIDKAYDVSPAYGMTVIEVTEEDIEDAPTVEAIPKADYENRLKADLKAILVKLQLEINEIPINPKGSEAFKLGQATAYDRCEFLIQQKINALGGKANVSKEK